MNHLTLTLSVVLQLATLAAAQKPTLEWQKRTSTIDYGSVPVGNHTLAELPVGQSWRLGANQQTVWRTAIPVIAGDAVLAPGNYVVSLNRTGEVACAITAGAFRVDGTFTKVDKPGKKLVIDLPKNGAAVNGNQPANFVVQFGEHEWKGAFTVAGNKTVAVGGGWKLAVFSLPMAHIDGRGKADAPIGALSKDDKEGWNLFVGDSEAKLVPWPQVGSGMPGAPAPKADPALTTTGKVEPMETKVDAEKPVVELLSAKLGKGSLTVEFVSGKQALRVTVPEPKAKAGK